MQVLNKYKNATELSKYIWQINLESKVKYFKQWKSYNNTTKRCSLSVCTHEKFIIIYHHELLQIQEVL